MRFLSTSSRCETKANPRKSIHKFPGEEERLETDEQFLKIMEDQKQRVAEHRKQQAILEANGGVPMEAEEEAKQVPSREEKIKDERRAIIAKMVSKHVPLAETSKAVDMFNTLIYGFLKNGALQDAQEVFDQMDLNNIPANKATFNMFAKFYSQQEPPMIEELQRVMDMMTSTVGVDVFTFNTLITSYAAIGKTCHSRPMFELMRSHDVKEDLTTCNILLINYARLTDGSALEYAEEVLLWMRNTGMVPDDTTYTALINCCFGNINRAMDFYEASISATKAGEISKYPNEERLSAMIRIFASVKQLDEGQAFITLFLAKNPSFQLSSGNYGAIFQLYVSCLYIKQAFDDLDSYLSLLGGAVPVATASRVVNALELLPESVLVENADAIKEWKDIFKKYKVRRNLSEADTAYWNICLLRWRDIYIPNAERGELKK